MSKDLPDKLISFQREALGNPSYLDGISPPVFIEITDAGHMITGHIAIYQGTTALCLGQESDDADPEEVWTVTTLGFLRGDDAGTPSQLGVEAGR